MTDVDIHSTWVSPDFPVPNPVIDPVDLKGHDLDSGEEVYE